MSKNPHWTREQYERWRVLRNKSFARDYNAGKAVHAIAHNAGVHKSTVYRALRKLREGRG